MKQIAKRTTWLALALSLSAASCGSSDSIPSTSAAVAASDAGQGQTIDLVSFWSTTGSAEMAQGLMDLHRRRHPADHFTNNSVGADILADVAQRVGAGDPPDLFTLRPPGELAAYLQTNGASALQPLDDFLASASEAGVLSNIYPEFIADVTVNGKLDAVPTGVVRANTLFYNKHVFAAQHLAPPTSIAEFRTTCQTLKAAGLTPVRAPILTLLLEAFLPEVMGLDAYKSYRAGAAPDQTALRNAVDLLAEVLDQYVAPPSASAAASADGNATTDEAIGAFMHDETAMLISGDWINGGLRQLGWTPGVDYEVASPPGNAGVFSYTTVALAVPAGAPHLQGALSFIDTVLSLDGQAATGTYAGTPIRKDVDSSTFEPATRKTTEDLKQATWRFGASFRCFMAWEPALGAFAQTHDKEALLQVLIANP